MSKSEELCELLGIEPVKKECPHKGCRNHITHPCEVCNNRRFICIYPDFTKPSNFVKLLELLTTKYLFGVALEDNEIVIEGFPYYDHKRESISELLINGLIAFLELEYSECEDCRDLERCKRTYQEPAQQTEWEY